MLNTSNDAFLRKEVFFNPVHGNSIIPVLSRTVQLNACYTLQQILQLKNRKQRLNNFNEKNNTDHYKLLEKPNTSINAKAYIHEYTDKPIKINSNVAKDGPQKKQNKNFAELTENYTNIKYFKYLFFLMEKLAKFMTFSAHMSNFMTFQILISKKSKFRTFHSIR